MSTSLYEDGVEYTCTHWWYDEEDNDYQLTATWKFEKNYPDMPDYWHLQDVEHADEILSGCRNGGNIWCWVESQGPDEIDLREVDYA
jgi:hypothetical protein